MNYLRILAFTIISVMLTNTLYAEPTLYKVVRVEKNDDLNMRSGPGADFSVVHSLQADTTGIRLLGDSHEKGKSLWVKIKVGDSEGWVNARYIKKVSNAAVKDTNSTSKANRQLQQDIKIAVYETLFTYYRADSQYVNSTKAGSHTTPSILPITVSTSSDIVTINFKDDFKESGIDWGEDDTGIGHVLLVNVQNVLAKHFPNKQMNVKFHFNNVNVKTYY